MKISFIYGVAAGMKSMHTPANQLFIEIMGGHFTIEKTKTNMFQLLLENVFLICMVDAP